MYWRVVIRLDDEQAIHCRFPNRVSAEVMYRLCKEELKDEKRFIDVHLIRCKPTMPADDDLGELGKFWCPYCGAWKNFWKRNNYFRCEVCWVSDADSSWQQANRWRYKQGARDRVVESPDELAKKQRRRERRMRRKVG